MTRLEFGSSAVKGTQEDGARLRPVMILVGTGYLFLTLCDSRDGIANLSIRFLLKDHLHLTALQLSGFLAMIKLAWYCKPFAGFLSDNVPFWGTHRKGYLVAFSAVAGALWLALAFFHTTYASMLGIVLAINFALMMVHTTLGGILVEAGQSLRATGRISSVRNGTENLGMLLAGLVGGWIAARLLGSGFLINAALMMVLAALFARMVRETRDDQAEPRPQPSTMAKLREVTRSRTLWTAAGFWVLVRFSPGFGTPLFFYQTETLGFAPQFIGYLGFASAAAALLGSLLYIRICRRFPLYRLLWLGVAMDACSSLAYFAYRSPGSAVAIEAVYGLCTALSFMPIFDLLARATPKGFEALGYALIFSLGSLSVNGSDVIGSWIFVQLHQSFSSMIWLNTATSAAVLFFIPFLPRALVAHRDGENSPDENSRGKT